MNNVLITDHLNHKQLPRTLSIVIPAKNEKPSLRNTITRLHLALKTNSIPHEIIVVSDNVTDATWKLLHRLQHEIAELKPIHNNGLDGFGAAVAHGLDQIIGDAVVIMMADGSDESCDVIRYWQELQKGYDCVFGSRFIAGGSVVNYPPHKYLLNRVANCFIKFLFRIKLNDTTNAFKAYRREVIESCRPFTSRYFELTLELPLKAIIGGFSWTVVPISWSTGKNVSTNFRMRKMGYRYLNTCLSIWLGKK